MLLSFQVFMIDAVQIAENLAVVRGNIDRAAANAGRNSAEITLVAVSKTFPAEAIEAAVAAGAADIGESRVQEGSEKVDRLGNICTWHLIGHLQSNKAGKAVKAFDMIHSIDSISLADKVSMQTLKQNKTIDCLVELNSSGEENKYGFTDSDLLLSAEKIIKLPGINLRGLMTIGPWTTDMTQIENAFDTTRQLFEKMQSQFGESMSILSMGMSSDYELAINHGSTMVRVGTAIFGEREKKK
jgi:pyridoxal phosphate enzyme (YggS family)